MGMSSSEVNENVGREFKTYSNIIPEGLKGSNIGPVTSQKSSYNLIDEIEPNQGRESINTIPNWLISTEADGSRWKNST